MTTHRKSSRGVIKSGFDRMRFKIECEKSFDRTFKYERRQNEYLLVVNALRNGSRSEKVYIKYAMYKNQAPFLAALSILKGARAYYPMDEDEKERMKKKDQNQDLSY